MSRDLDRPSSIVVENPSFPYFVQEPGKKTTSYVSIERDYEYDMVTSSLFWAGGASLEIRSGTRSGLSEGTVRAYHSFARDVESDRSSYFVADIKGIQLVSAYDGLFKFAGFLTGVQFFPEGYEDSRYEGDFNPFVGAKKKSEADGKYYANSGYPYLPPKVDFGKYLVLPLEVIVTAHVERENTQKNLEDALVRIEEAKAEKAEKKRLENEERDARRARWAEQDKLDSAEKSE